MNINKKHIKFLLTIITLVLASIWILEAMYPNSDKEIEKLKDILKNQPNSIYLNPQKKNKDISILKSKIGGTPNLVGFNTWPACKHCNAKLNFILQLYKRDFPTFYFPKNKNLFLLFRCPNPKCSDAFSEPHDHSMSWLYLKTDKMYTDKSIPHPKQPQNDDWEQPIPVCEFKPVEIRDFPNSYEERYILWQKAFKDFDEKFENDDLVYDEFLRKCPNWYGTKIGGFPSWTQNYYNLKCKCKNDKIFLFQLSTNYGIRFPSDNTKPEAHEIQIGDAGNIYFFICEKCGSGSIETLWDCE